MSLLKTRINLLNVLCRICGKEEKKYISIFSETGIKQGIHRKIHACLPITVEETDSLPKQICLQCLPKLEATWDLICQCKEAQITIAQRLDSIAAAEVDEGQAPYLVTIEEKIKCLSESNPITLGESAVISLAPSSPPRGRTKLSTSPPGPVLAPVVAPTSENVLGVIPTQGMLANTAPMTYMQSPATDNIQLPQTVTTPAITKADVYPEGLIQVKSNNKPVIYQQRSERKSLPVPAPRNVPKPIPAPKQNVPTSPLTARRRALREGDSNNVPAAKRSHRLCTICNKSFPDEIIDHHISLHMRQSFFTCLDCNKNFRSEMAMSKHRCGVNNSINLDPDDEPICV